MNVGAFTFPDLPETYSWAVTLDETTINLRIEQSAESKRARVVQQLFIDIDEIPIYQTNNIQGFVEAKAKHLTAKFNANYVIYNQVADLLETVDNKEQAKVDSK